jgi:hypothetical protein
VRNIMTAAIVTGALLTVPAMTLASQATPGAKAPAAASRTASTAQAPTHATRGVVTFVGSTTLVVERSPRYGGNMTFLLNPSTERDGNVKVGSTVEVRYRTDAHQRIATVVTVEPAKAAPSAPASHQ